MNFSVPLKGKLTFLIFIVKTRKFDLNSFFCCCFERYFKMHWFAFSHQYLAALSQINYIISLGLQFFICKAAACAHTSSVTALEGPCTLSRLAELSLLMFWAAWNYFTAVTCKKGSFLWLSWTCFLDLFCLFLCIICFIYPEYFKMAKSGF